MSTPFYLKTFDVAKFDSILARGLSCGLGIPGEQVCIEAAICETLGLPHGDDPQCVTTSVRSFKIKLNDAYWSSPAARAQGLRPLGLAQLGSKGVVDPIEFSRKLAEKTIRVLLPTLFRELAVGRAEWLTVADRCEREGTAASAYASADAAYASGPCRRDFYLTLSASLALDVLRELKSPGVALLET